MLIFIGIIIGLLEHGMSVKRIEEYYCVLKLSNRMTIKLISWGGPGVRGAVGPSWASPAMAASAAGPAVCRRSAKPHVHGSVYHGSFGRSVPEAMFSIAVVEHLDLGGVPRRDRREEPGAGDRSVGEGRGAMAALFPEVSDLHS